MLVRNVDKTKIKPDECNVEVTKGGRVKMEGQAGLPGAGQTAFSNVKAVLEGGSGVPVVAGLILPTPKFCMYTGAPNPLWADEEIPPSKAISNKTPYRLILIRIIPRRGLFIKVILSYRIEGLSKPSRFKPIFISGQLMNSFHINPLR